MNVRLVHFRYYFTMTGKVRNLFYIDCQFQPILPDGASEEEAKACARELPSLPTSLRQPVPLGISVGR